MTVAALRPPSALPLTLLRWSARLGSVVSLGLLGVFVFSGGWAPTAWEWVALVFFPGGVMAGMLIGWRRELLGGVVTAVSVTAIYALLLARDGRLGGPWFAVFAAPGLAFLVCGLLARGNRRG